MTITVDKMFPRWSNKVNEWIFDKPFKSNKSSAFVVSSFGFSLDNRTSTLSSLPLLMDGSITSIFDWFLPCLVSILDACLSPLKCCVTAASPLFSAMNALLQAEHSSSKLFCFDRKNFRWTLCHLSKLGTFKTTHYSPCTLLTFRSEY